MRKLLNLVKWGATLGSEPQAFLSAKWIGKFLSKTAESKRRIWALRMLSLSPHYFINPDDPKYKGLSHDEYLEAVYKDCIDSRVKIFEYILRPYVSAEYTILDYGCGPGFLAGFAAPHIKKLYACDISTGALACANILNPAPNLEYIVADETGLGTIADGSLDVIYSFAMVQHLTDEVFEIVLVNCSKKLKSGGRLVMHIQLTDSQWKTEDEWKADTSLQGKLKFKYGLHCFGRTEQYHIDAVSRHGFKGIKIESIADFIPEDFDDICSQSLLTAINEK
ncbi:MAG: class I SAM-dependent methyltransferase [Blastocatellia bacterium]